MTDKTREEWKKVWFGHECQIDEKNDLFSDNEGNVYSLWDVIGFGKADYELPKTTDYPLYQQGDHVSMGVEFEGSVATLYFECMYVALAFKAVIMSCIAKLHEGRFAANLKPGL